MEIQRQSIAAFKMSIARENSQLARRMIQVDTKYGDTAGSYRGVGKLYADCARQAGALQLEVGKSGLEGNLGFRATSLSAEHGQRDGTVGRKPHHTAVFKLNFSASIVAGRQQRALKQRSVLDRRIGKQFLSLGKLHLAFNAAESYRACSRGRVVSPHTHRGRSSAKYQPQDCQHTRLQPARFQHFVLHGALPPRGPTWTRITLAAMETYIHRTAGSR
jgi:hypothetical protein